MAKKELKFYEWLIDRNKRGEDVRLVSLLIDTDNNDMLKLGGKRLVESGFFIEIDESVDLEDKETRERINRHFMYEVNKEALKYMLEVNTQMMIEVDRSQKMFRELLERNPSMDKEAVAEMEENIRQMKQEAIDYAAHTAFIKEQFEDNADAYVDSGEIWFKDDKQLVIELLDELEEVKDESTNNLLTASTLINKIDNLIGRINLTIEKLDLLLDDNAENEQGIDVELDRLDEGQDKVSRSVEESRKPKIEDTQLEEIETEGQKAEVSQSTEQEQHTEQTQQEEERQEVVDSELETALKEREEKKQETEEITAISMPINL